MVGKRTISEKTFNVFNIFVLFLLTVITLYPVWYVLVASLSNAVRLESHSGLLLIPKGFSVQSYRMVFRNPNILTGYSNTLFIVIVGTALNILMSSMAAYILSRKQFRIRKTLMFLIIFTMYFSGGMIPRYLLISNTLGLGNNLLALILPGAISTSNLIVMKTRFEDLPVSLEESARLDGANDFGILFRIVLPLSKAIISVMILFYGVSHWNSWFDAVLFIRDKQLYPLQVILREILISNNTDAMVGGASGADQYALSANIKYATIVVATAPILCVYPFIQRYFVRGVMMGAVKG